MLFRSKKDWTPTPAAAAYRNLVFDQWSTKTKGTADDKGIFKVRGFLGDYTINVTGDGLAKEIQVQLPKEGKTVTIQ